MRSFIEHFLKVNFLYRNFKYLNSILRTEDIGKGYFK